MPGFTRVEAAMHGGAAAAPDWYSLIDFINGNDATSGRRYTIDHAAPLDLPSTGWAWGIYYKLSSLDTGPSYLINAGTFGGSPSFSLFVTGTDQTTPNSVGLNVNGNGIETAAQFVTTDQEVLVVAQYDGTTLELYTCLPGQAAVLQDSAAVSLGNITLATDWFVGARSDLDNTRFFDQELGGPFKASRELTPAEIAQIAAGGSPVTALTSDCAGAWAFLGGALATEQDLTANDNDATRQGTGWPGQATGISLGTTGTLAWDNSSQGTSYTVSSGLTIDGGGAGLIIGFHWCNAFGTRNNDVSDPAITLNGVAPTAVLSTHTRNTGSNREQQTVLAYWASPAAGDVVFTLPSDCDATAAGGFFINVTGLAASPLGQVVRAAGPTDPLPFQLTPGESGSLVISAVGTIAGDEGPFVWDDGGTLLADQGGSGAANGSFAVRTWLEPTVSVALDVGGAFTGGDALDGQALELLAA